MACPTENELLQFTLGSLEGVRAERVTEHLAECELCRNSFAEVARAHPVQSGPSVQPGDVVAEKYEVIAPLGEGGMGVVVKARHLHLNTEVALKFLRPMWRDDPSVLDRFKREARAASRLTSPHINRVLDFEQPANAAPFIVLEFLQGETLHHRLERDPPVETREAVAWLRQILSALEEAHGFGIVHRDIKPKNVMLRTVRDGKPAVAVVLDFGVARSSHPDIESGLHHSTTVGAFIGSPAFMAPEQFDSACKVDARTDLWAVGCTAYRLLGGRLPFDASNLIDLAASIRRDAPAPLSRAVPSAVRGWIEKCLEKRPENRFGSARAAREALEGLELPQTRSFRWSVVGAAAVVALGAAVMHFIPVDSLTESGVSVPVVPAAEKVELPASSELQRQEPVGEPPVLDSKPVSILDAGPPRRGAPKRVFSRSSTDSDAGEVDVFESWR